MSNNAMGKPCRNMQRWHGKGFDKLTPLKLRKKRTPSLPETKDLGRENSKEHMRKTGLDRPFHDMIVLPINPSGAIPHGSCGQQGVKFPGMKKQWG